MPEIETNKNPCVVDLYKMGLEDSRSMLKRVVYTTCIDGRNAYLCSQ